MWIGTDFQLIIVYPPMKKPLDTDISTGYRTLLQWCTIIWTTQTIKLYVFWSEGVSSRNTYTSIGLDNRNDIRCTAKVCVWQRRSKCDCARRFRWRWRDQAQVNVGVIKKSRGGWCGYRGMPVRGWRAHVLDKSVCARARYRLTSRALSRINRHILLLLLLLL